jgi:hypothetical protein
MDALFGDPVLWFADWPNAVVPTKGAIVYTIWDRDGRFIYVGMSGRGVAADTAPSATGKGPWGRLNSHASGRRSGDQFCVYVCDRLVLPTLHNRLEDIRDGRVLLDSETRTYIRTNLGYRWVICPDGGAALALERSIQRGETPAGLPLLNGTPSRG